MRCKPEPPPVELLMLRGSPGPKPGGGAAGPAGLVEPGPRGCAGFRWDGWWGSELPEDPCMWWAAMGPLMSWDTSWKDLFARAGSHAAFW